MSYVVPERSRPSQRRWATPDPLPAAARETRLAQLIREPLELLELERLGVALRPHRDDDQERSTRRLGARQKRQ